MLQKIEILPGTFRIRRADLEAIAAGQGKSRRGSIWSSIFERIKFFILWSETQLGGKKQDGKIDPS
jgi:hypothetical protein